MNRLLATRKMPHPAVSQSVQSKFKGKLEKGMVPTRVVKKGTHVDRTISRGLAFSLCHKMKFSLPFSLQKLMSCNPNGNIGDDNRFNGMSFDGNPGQHATYQSIVVKEFGAAPGMVAELRHYGKKRIEAAPIILPGQYTHSSIVGKNNPAFAFLDQIIIRAVVPEDIVVINFDFSDKEVLSFIKSFSQEIQPELKILKCLNLDQALFLPDDHSVARPIGNLILEQAGIAGLMSTSARDELIEEGPWKKFEQNLVLKADPTGPSEFLDLSSIFLFENKNGKAHFYSRKPDEVVSLFLEESQRDENSGDTSEKQ